MRAASRTLALFLASAALTAVPARAHQACASSHFLQARLASFPAAAVSRPLYWASEGQGSARFKIQILGALCDRSTVTIGYEVENGSATTPGDYVAPPRQFTFVNTTGHPREFEGSVEITNDPLPDENGVEHATIALSNASGITLSPPSEAPLAIVDDDGLLPRVSLLEGPYEESESTPTGGVPVFRAGDASGATEVTYTLTGSSATEGADYAGPFGGTLTFAAGERMKLIPVTVIDDTEQELEEVVTVSISGATVEGTSTVQLTIIDNEGGFPPSSTIHHPNQGKRYPASKYLIREVHVFTSEATGSGVAAAEFALRRNMKNRSCGWWTGKKFKSGKCDAERWLKTKQYETDFFYIRLKELAPSVRDIRNYTAYSRAIDGAENVETDFEVGRNANTFEIKKKKKR